DEADASQEPEPEEELAVDEATGEEEEEVIFRSECKLWKLVRHPGPATTAEAGSGNGAAAETSSPSKAEDKGWKWIERGCGVVHVNRHRKTGAGRLVMRMRGILKVLLNTPVFPTTTYEKVGQKSVRFVGVHDQPSEKGEVVLSAFRVTLQSNDSQGKFLATLRELVSKSAA
ncbi:unnamed protein product, partial [Polarella glacialis]